MIPQDPPATTLYIQLALYCHDTLTIYGHDPIIRHVKASLYSSPNFGEKILLSGVDQSTHFQTPAPLSVSISLILTEPKHTTPHLSLLLRFHSILHNPSSSINLLSASVCTSSILYLYHRHLYIVPVVEAAAYYQYLPPGGRATAFVRLHSLALFFSTALLNLLFFWSLVFSTIIHSSSSRSEQMDPNRSTGQQGRTASNDDRWLVPSFLRGTPNETGM